MPAELPRTLCVSLHDVAPATLADCARTLAFLDDLHLGPVALLVIPDFHGTGRVDRDRRFMSFIESRILRAAGWQPSGFVAPDWLMSGGTCDALATLHAANSILRIALHPTDQRDPAFQRFWRNLRLRIDGRQVLTEDQLVSRLTRRAGRLP